MSEYQNWKDSEEDLDSSEYDEYSEWKSRIEDLIKNCERAIELKIDLGKHEIESVKEAASLDRYEASSDAPEVSSKPIKVELPYWSPALILQDL